MGKSFTKGNEYGAIGWKDELESPYFLIDKMELDYNIRELERALEAHWRNAIIAYSFKTNSLPWLLRYLKQKGLYAEIVSDDEYELALAMGYEKRRIVYNGPIKSKESFLDAIESGALVNIDSQRELDWLSELRHPKRTNAPHEVGLRINFELERHCPGETKMGEEGDRFGFCYENGELQKAIAAIEALEHVVLRGIHFHSNTKTRSLNVYRMIAKMACEIKETYDLDLSYVDVGGGFFGGLPNKPQYSEYMSVMARELRKSFREEKTTLIVEPGNALIASPVHFVTQVIDTKQTTVNCFVVIDGSRFNVDPLFQKNSYFFSVEYKDTSKRSVLETQVVSGFSCMENDRLFVLKDAPELLPGDRMIFHKVGAYTMALSPLFIRYFPDVYVADRGHFTKVRDRWSVQDYLAESSIPVHPVFARLSETKRCDERAVMKGVTAFDETTKRNL